MLDIDTFSLIFILGSLIILSTVGLHYANCSKEISKKRREFENLSYLLEKKILNIEQEVVDIRMQIDTVNEQIEALQQ